MSAQWQTLQPDALQDAIDRQIALTRSLHSDLTTPHNLQRNLAHAQEVVDGIAERLDGEIARLQAQLNAAIAGRADKIKSAIEKRDALQFRLENIRELYIEESETLEAMQQRLKLLDSSGKIAKARSLAAQLAELESKLPANLRGKSIEEITAALNEGAE